MARFRVVVEKRGTLKQFEGIYGVHNLLECYWPIMPVIGVCIHKVCYKHMCPKFLSFFFYCCSNSIETIMIANQ